MKKLNHIFEYQKVEENCYMEFDFELTNEVCVYEL